MKMTDKPEQEDTVDISQYLTKHNLMLLAIWLAMLILVLLAGYYLGYNAANINLSELYAEQYKDCICFLK